MILQITISLLQQKTENLRNNKNTEELVKNANKRIRLLHALDLKTTCIQNVDKKFI